MARRDMRDIAGRGRVPTFLDSWNLSGLGGRRSVGNFLAALGCRAVFEFKFFSENSFSVTIFRIFF